MSMRARAFFDSVLATQAASLRVMQVKLNDYTLTRLCGAFGERALSAQSMSGPCRALGIQLGKSILSQTHKPHHDQSYFSHQAQRKQQGAHHVLPGACFLFFGPMGPIGRIGPISCDRFYGIDGIDSCIGLIGWMGLILVMGQSLPGAVFFDTSPIGDSCSVRRTHYENQSYETHPNQSYLSYQSQTGIGPVRPIRPICPSETIRHLSGNVGCLIFVSRTSCGHWRHRLRYLSCRKPSIGCRQNRWNTRSRRDGSAYRMRRRARNGGCRATAWSR